jgi:hypothetical protein
MKNIALFLNHQTNHQKNKLPSPGFQCSFEFLVSGARNVKVVLFVDQNFIHFPNKFINLVVIFFEVEMLPTQFLGKII